jgi:hypothetical protein
MPPPWFEVPQHFPEDGLECCVRRIYFAAAFDAVWDASAGCFVLDNGYTIPWFMVARWKVRV